MEVDLDGEDLFLEGCGGTSIDGETEGEGAFLRDGEAVTGGSVEPLGGERGGAEGDAGVSGDLEVGPSGDLVALIEGVGVGDGGLGGHGSLFRLRARWRLGLGGRGVEEVLDGEGADVFALKAEASPDGGVLEVGRIAKDEKEGGTLVLRSGGRLDGDSVFEDADGVYFAALVEDGEGGGSEGDEAGDLDGDRPAGLGLDGDVGGEGGHAFEVWVLCTCELAGPDLGEDGFCLGGERDGVEEGVVGGGNKDFRAAGLLGGLGQVCGDRDGPAGSGERGGGGGGGVLGIAGGGGGERPQGEEEKRLARSGHWKSIPEKMLCAMAEDRAES